MKKTRLLKQKKLNRSGCFLLILMTTFLFPWWPSLKLLLLKCGLIWCTLQSIAQKLIKYQNWTTISSFRWYSLSTFSLQLFSLWICSSPLLLTSLMKKLRKDRELIISQTSKKSGSRYKGCWCILTPRSSLWSLSTVLGSSALRLFSRKPSSTSSWPLL